MTDPLLGTAVLLLWVTAWGLWLGERLTRLERVVNDHRKESRDWYGILARRVEALEVNAGKRFGPYPISEERSRRMPHQPPPDDPGGP